MSLVQDLIGEVRALRKEIGAEEKAVTPIEVSINEQFRHFIQKNSDIVERLARVAEIRYVTVFSDGLAKHSAAIFDVAVVYEKKIDVAAERERLTKDIAKYEKGLSSAERQLSNEAFLKKAPPQVVEGLKKQEAETRLLLEKARAALENLNKEN
jgi:valyl-tRNA synthetase